MRSKAGSAQGVRCAGFLAASTRAWSTQCPGRTSSCSVHRSFSTTAQRSTFSMVFGAMVPAFFGADTSFMVASKSSRPFVMHSTFICLQTQGSQP